MRSIQQKLMLYVVIIGVIPMMFFTFYFYNLRRDTLLSHLDAESKNILEQHDNKIAAKINRIQNTVDILLNDAELHRSLRELDTAENAHSDMQNKLNDIYEKFARGEKEILSLLIFPVNGEMYISGDETYGIDARHFLLQYDNSRINTGQLTWMGLKEQSGDYDSNVLVAGISLRDTTYRKDERYIATAYVVFDDFIFSRHTNLANPPEDASGETAVSDDNENITIYDENINMIYTMGDKRLSGAFLSLQDMNSSTHFGKSTDTYTSEYDGDKYMVSIYTSPVTGWKLVRTFSYSRYTSPLRTIIYMTILFLALVMAVWYVVNCFVVRRMTLPIRELLDAMIQVKKENFDVEVKVREGKDFAIISEGFNSMVRCVKELFQKVQAEEKKRSEQDTLLLQYQMNPHFLYNTIGMIRGLALVNKQHEIAKMLLVLSRFLRNAILTTQDMLFVSEEMDNINDYIYLHQMRYCNQLNFSIEADEECVEYKIPSMLCQPIIENSLMHGLHDKFYSGDVAEIKMKIEQTEDMLIISIYDNGCGISREKIDALFSDDVPETKVKATENSRLHIGLKNTQRRIQLLFGDKYGVKVESEPDKYTLVSLKLPKIKNIQRRDEIEAYKSESDN